MTMCSTITGIARIPEKNSSCQFIVSGLDIQPQQSDNDHPACNKVVPGCQIQQVIYSFLPCKWLRWLTMSLVTWVQVSLGYFAWHWACQCTDMLAFLLLCSLYFFFLGFCQWQFCSVRVLTLNMNTRLPLFWSTWSRSLGQDSTKCAGLAHGRDYSYCRGFFKPNTPKQSYTTIYSSSLAMNRYQWQTSPFIISASVHCSVL